ncbi:hypothetical protein ACVW8L_004544 [Vibrio parahaemolyticus]|uniref:hypothetical protein n=1 Tax=Vibrio TaxID=662 RepID=UPI00193CBDDF|nr:hypothetical protein [Vibrio parahaemolyticus]EIV1855749.1 hypothetical protein [Vibrio vulnificus]EGQ7821176.1 hypothetical protein [Vibrio parahaemolyticus]EGQ9123332.1 hypothetical protein [Vibrio parahaemolyticus]EGR2734240.1 hypothetical protein [Vibrio parahaemolyticus]EGR2885338.1 hypothetical protein [Vibrio parahaemolyticus]
MSLVKVFYQHREGGTELVDHEKELKFHREACETIDNYPWQKELELFEELGEGGGFFFLLGDMDGKFASYQFTPVESDRGLLDLEVVSKLGFIGIFGRKSVSVDFKLVSIPEAKHQIKELFEYSIDSLYQKYRK